MDKTRIILLSPPQPPPHPIPTLHHSSLPPSFIYAWHLPYNCCGLLFKIVFYTLRNSIKSCKKNIPFPNSYRFHRLFVIVIEQCQSVVPLKTKKDKTHFLRLLCHGKKQPSPFLFILSLSHDVVSTLLLQGSDRYSILYLQWSYISLYFSWVSSVLNKITPSDWQVRPSSSAIAG